MNQAVGFPCPECGHDHAELLEFVKSAEGYLIGFRLLCARCETAFSELRLAPEAVPVLSEALRD